MGLGILRNSWASKPVSFRLSRVVRLIIAMGAKYEKWVKAKECFKIFKEKAGEGDSIYKAVAKLRLQKV